MTIISFDRFKNCLLFFKFFIKLLRSKLGIYLPKLEEKCNYLLEEEWKSLSRITDGNNNKKVFNLMNDHFSLRKQTIKDVCGQFISAQREKEEATRHEGKIKISRDLFFYQLFNLIIFL